MGKGFYTCWKNIQTTRLGGKYGRQCIAVFLFSSLVCYYVCLHDCSWTMVDYLFFNVCSSGIQGATCCVVVIMCLRSSLKILPFPVSFTAMETGKSREVRPPFFSRRNKTNFTLFCTLWSYPYIENLELTHLSHMLNDAVDAGQTQTRQL